MFNKIIEDYYKKLAGSIKERKKFLNLNREDILTDPKRVTQITKNVRDKHHPYLIGKSEYAYLYYLFIKEDEDSFINEKTLSVNPDKHIEKNGDNYDKMLWGHIEWDKMFEDTIAELSELDLSEDLGELFDYTLTDYVPYAIIKYDELHPEYGKEYIFPDDRGNERQNAIHWVYLRHGSDFFKQVFSEKFKGKTLDKFDDRYREFVKEYLEKMKPDSYSLGLQAYNFHKNISGFAAYWQSLAEVQYKNTDSEDSDLEKLIAEYIANGRTQIQLFKKYQIEFDAFNVDIKS